MPGKQDSNLRSGHLAEAIALDYLRPFAFVAPSPNPDDIGFDAVATLIREEGRRLYAEESFLVQVKSRSFPPVVYTGPQLDWLRELELPFFFLRANLLTSRFELFSIAHGSRDPNFRDRSVVTFTANKAPLRLDGESMEVGLGDPILEWGPKEAFDPNFRQQAYCILKEWVSREREGIAKRNLGMAHRMTWNTNEVPVQDSAYTIMCRGDEIPEVLEKLKVAYQRLSMHAINLDGENDDLLVGLFYLLQFMRRHGVDPDPPGIIPLIHSKRQKQLAQQAADGNPNYPYILDVLP